MAAIENLTPGTRVRVPRRGGATGTIQAPDPVGAWFFRANPPARPTVSIKFDGQRAGHGLNYPEDVEILEDGPVCECGQPGTEVCYRKGSSEEVWFCRSRKHTPKIREMATQGWMSQSATVAASKTGEAMRRRAQSA